MRIFYLNNNILDKQIYFLEIYKLYKENICYFEQNNIKLRNILRSEDNDFLNKTLLFFILEKKQKDCQFEELYISENDVAKQNKFDFYLNIIGNYDIINKKYIPLINEFKKDLFDNIEIFPSCLPNSDYIYSENRMFIRKSDLTHDSPLLQKIFYKFFGEKISIYESFSKYSFIYSLLSNTKQDKLEIQNKIYEDIEINNNIIFSNEQNFKYPIGKYHVFIHKINLYLDKLEEFLIKNIEEGNIDSSLISKYLAHFYLSILNLKPIKRDIFNYYDRYINEFIKFNLERDYYTKIILIYIIYYKKSYSKDRVEFKINYDVIISNYEKENFNLENYWGFTMITVLIL